MKLRTFLLMATGAAISGGANAQNTVAHFDMSLNNGSIVEAVSNMSYPVSSQLSACTVQGVDGDALRFDGYSSYVRAALPGGLSTEALTVSVVLAVESYPMMQMDVAETVPTFAAICGNLDETGKKGFAFELSSQGDLRFRFGSATGFLMTVTGSKKLPRGRWCQLTAVLDKAGNAATLYLNGESIGTGRMSRAAIAHSGTDFYIGKDATDKKEGPFLINTFCGLIDDIRIDNEALSNEKVKMNSEEFAGTSILADFNYPAERYESSLWRPQFHGMPSGSWTNESHGLIYSGGRYHVFFQKNPNGPYMSRLHWGHISSENLYDWREEPIAIYPGESYDIKGCWSGCVYEDGGDTYILYTAVDNARATIAQARAKDSNLIEWEKLGVIINGRPSGLSDDFRDPYFFTAGGQKYIIVGTSKNGIGACTLHKYENGTWTNDGTLFFQGSNANQHGTFWEMPNVTPMGDGKYLFTCTPLGTGVGVRTLCWTGTIGNDGKFTPDATGVQYLEMGGISRDGYGLLSPSIYRHPAQTGEGSGEGLLLLGIVPDKLPTQTNFEMGWAHNFSLPRELHLAADGSLIQRPYSGLAAMRTATTFTMKQTLLGSESLSPVSGRQIELIGEFTATTGTCGFRFLKAGNHQASLTYDADRKTLTLDLTALNRQANDNGSYNGLYTVNMTEALTQLHVFLDASIADIFVNDRWAYSVRLFPTDASAIEAEVFTTASMPVKVSAWTLDVTQSADGIEEIEGSRSFKYGASPSAGREGERRGMNPSVCDLQGRKVNHTNQKGIYLQGGRKYVKS